MIFRRTVKPAQAKPQAAPKTQVGRFLTDRKGATAIEFAALAIPFCLLVFAILESCISFAAQQMLINATDNVARELRTGQITAPLSQQDLHDRICNQIDLIVAKNCPGLAFDLRSFDTFEQAAKIRTKFTADGDIDTAGFEVAPGPSTSRNMLRVFYRWPVITDFLRKAMSNLKGDKTLLFATATWQNEPFDD